MKISRREFVGVGLASVASLGVGGYAFEYGSIPPHPVNGGNAAGGDEVFADGSANWFKFITMHRFNNYAGALVLLTTISIKIQPISMRD